MAVVYRCNCQDSAKNRDAANKIINFVPFESGWENSEGGAILGQCKHILAARIIRGELKKGDIPTDLEFEFEKEEVEKEKYQKGYAGNSFMGNINKIGGI
jgi:hypothetical protein